MKKKPEELFRLAKQAMMRSGAREAMADAAAQHLVRAEEQGLPTHGLSRVPFYCGMLKNGRADGAAQPSMRTEKAAVCLIDNADALPYESCAWAIEEVIQRARRNGIGFAGITNSAHVGVLGIHLLKVAAAGLVGVAFTNSPAAIPAWGGKKALFGTDPVAFAFPRQGADPIDGIRKGSGSDQRGFLRALSSYSDHSKPRGLKSIHLFLFSRNWLKYLAAPPVTTAPWRPWHGECPRY